MKGYRTIIAMLLGLLFSLLTAMGWVIPENDQAAIQTAVLAIIGLYLRFKTSGPIGKP